ncbi:Iron-sulfur cluster repair protein YtfE, RIC family, contains ScdAN and hemerythrin domains [Fodinibius salinus]|uniref:Iron-sulfur cluster repair protein YtfE, RIC family, contains ScdAN and hemerythrin domains n=1 Tax=Fodinibius salinus TaxID=860790 RepID=A0A5D3YP69_9BACT|nr:hemerythrin domain-containing protein [Fodinibius salinus]TYP94819.1 Iron-sulfur cluster repair protein YtfE, RIC family, contains ScdAN and hemerythrin domains [Fodinibius salinus]
MKSEQSLEGLTPNATLSQILSVYQKAGGLLESIGLNVSEHKQQTLSSVCRQKKWSEDEVLEWLKEKQDSRNNISERENGSREDFGDNLSEWSSYVEEAYHSPTFQLIQDIDERFPRIKKVHGNQYPWIKKMEHSVTHFLQDFRLYLKFESKKFFPLIRKFDNNKGKVLDGTVRELKRSHKIIANDQQRLRNKMDAVREKGNGFKNPEHACTTLRILNHQFKQLDTMLAEQFEIEQQHILPLVQQKFKTV